MEPAREVLPYLSPPVLDLSQSLFSFLPQKNENFHNMFLHQNGLLNVMFE